MQPGQSVQTVIIGAGLTGLSTAHFLKKAGKQFLVLEKNDGPGGVINTLQEKGFVYETGPNTGVLGSAEIVEIFDDLKSECEVETADANAQKRYILKNAKWEALPSGLMGGIKTPLFTLKDKFRLLAEPFRSKGTNPNETLSELVRRRMGQSFLDYAIDPFIIGVYAGDPDILVPRYALPKLYNLEQDFGSFIGGAVKKQFKKKSEAEKKVTRKVFSAQGGLSNLVNAMYNRAGKENFVFGASNVQVSLPGDASQKAEGLYKVIYQQDGRLISIQAKHVVFTGGAFELPQVFPFIDHTDMEKFNNLRYAQVIEATLGFDKWEGMPLDGFGGLIPSKEKRQILGVLFMSTLFQNRAPKEGALLTIFLGGIRNKALTELPDEKIKEIVKKEAMDLMSLPSFNPSLFKLTRYKHAIPQYEASSGERFDTINKLEKQYFGLIFGGNMRDGIGMADRAKQGRMLADQVINSGK
jgi:protoporphyrinogen/coproporphyrinogen III oxidase